MSDAWRWEYDPGWLYFLAMPRLRLIVITRVIPPYEDL
ncbi:hypothetical protein SAMN04490356_2544 [Streptomyces melanosporofaciens]|uniref:Uncharacterized protein n=1 Tax=Streptomyces melanosporofaciens TaxID=67327 RepID=A0A1H4P0F8_STRMJ|nr:hypothetical protein SAMN04490356_2544 [Streptomyces melanosporofaciens]